MFDDKLFEYLVATDQIDNVVGVENKKEYKYKENIIIPKKNEINKKDNLKPMKSSPKNSNKKI